MKLVKIFYTKLYYIYFLLFVLSNILYASDSVDTTSNNRTIEYMNIQPERLLLYEVITQTITEWRWSTEQEFLDKVKSTTNEISKSYDFKKIVANNDNINATSSSQADLKLKIHKIVEDKYSIIFRGSPESKIKSYPKQKPRNIFLSGNSINRSYSYFTRLLQTKLNHNGINWHDVVKIDPELLVQLLKYNGIYQKEELDYLSTKVIAPRVKQALANKEITYVVWINNLLSLSSINWSLHNTYQVIVYFIVNTNTNTNTEPDIVTKNLPVTNFTHKYTSEYSGKELYVTLFDKGQSGSISKVLELYSAQKYAVIYNENLLQKIINNYDINRNTSLEYLTRLLQANNFRVEYKT